MVRHRIIPGVVLIGWWLCQFFWLSADRLIRDGDEEGHVGAMELFKDTLHQEGLIRWIQEIWMGDYGEYPPLFAGILGAWWACITTILGTTPPASLWIKGFLPLSIVITAIACARISWRFGHNWQLAGLWVLCSPLMNGVGRHFMPEGWMTMWVTLSLMWCVESQHQSPIRNILWAGLCAGCALMTKQTAMIFLAPSYIFIALHFRENLTFRQILGFTIIVLMLTLPWYGQQFGEQIAYLSASAAGKTSAGGWTQIYFYPTRWLLDLPNLVALCALLWYRPKVPLWLWGWLGSMLILMLIPKQYPRLMITWLPSVPLLLATISFTRWWSSILIVSASIGLGFHSFHPIQPRVQQAFSSIQSRLDDGCAQQWIRPPSDIDGQLSIIAAHIETTHATAIYIDGDPTIPCKIQSTYNWQLHLEPYLRRRGLDIEIYDITNEHNASSQWQDGSIQIVWKGDTIESDIALHHHTGQ